VLTCAACDELVIDTFLSQAGIKLIDQKKEPFKFTQAHENEVRRVLREYSSKRPIPKREYDQFYTTEDTQVKRIKLISESHDLEHTSILFLGDDDLTSVCLGILGLTKRIAVLDIDQRQLSFIETVAKTEKFKLEIYLSDFREGIPADLKKGFDVIFTDTPYTPDGFELFMCRALEACKNLQSTLYMCFGTSERSIERLLPIQEIISRKKLVIKDAFWAFNSYSGAESIGDSSNLYVLKPTPSTVFNKKPTGKRQRQHQEHHPVR
jgi:predicted methyltransferase